MAQSSTFDLLSVDDFYFSAMFDYENEGDMVPISDDKYAEELQFQETLMSSVIAQQNPTHELSVPPSILCLSISDDKYAEELQLQGTLMSSTQQNPTDELSVPRSILSLPISDDKYAEELQFQETLMSSAITQQNPTDELSVPPSILCLPSSSKAVEEFSLSHTFCLQSSTSSSKAVEEFSLVLETEQMESVKEAGASSQIICEICAENKGKDQMFRNQRCNHSFCSDCVTRQVATKIQESITVVSCPGLDCKGVLELDACRPLLPKDLLDRWDEALCATLFLAAPKFYCPFKDCSVMLLNDNEGEGIRESECPVCHRLFCARCSVPWHAGIECQEFQKLNEDERGREDLLLRELVNEKKWSRCPRCKFYVEKNEGCLHITCRCRFEFCYRCGKPWTSTHVC